jgi:hypothetical protein
VSLCCKNLCLIYSVPVITENESTQWLESLSSKQFTSQLTGPREDRVRTYEWQQIVIHITPPQGYTQYLGKHVTQVLFDCFIWIISLCTVNHVNVFPWEGWESNHFDIQWLNWLDYWWLWVTHSLRWLSPIWTKFIQPPIQWVAGTLTPRHEADHSRPSSTKVKNLWHVAWLSKGYLHLSDIWGCHSSEDSSWGLLGCDIM